MNNHRHNYTSDDLSLNKAHGYNLLLQIDASGFDYAVIADDEVLAWGENYPIDELQDPQLLREILTANYKQVVTGIQATGFTLLPNSLFDEERITDIARLLDVTETEKVIAQNLDSLNTIVYKVDEALINRVNDLDNKTITYTNAGFIKAVANSVPTNNSLYLNIGYDTVSFVNFKDKELRFYNTFVFKTHDELAYFCALVIKELQIEPIEVVLKISGDINITDKYFTYLQEFFGEVELNTEQVLNLPSKIQSHKILSLAALSLCASSEEN